MLGNLPKYLLLIGLITFSVPGLAQDETAGESNNEVTESEVESEENGEESSSNTSSSGQKFERVQVTGSLIRRADFEGPSPIQIIDRQSLDQSAYNSVSDYLRDMPISSYGAQREDSGSTAAGVSGVNLRGLGEENTLVLLNGARLPIDGTVGYVNMNLIPEIVIDNSEILKDGASATYGSDAVGGVVALKTRKDFTGVEGSIRQTINEEKGGQRTDIGVIGGKHFGSVGIFKNVSVTAAAQYRYNDRIYDRDRSFTEPDDKGIIGWSQYGPVPNYMNSAGNWTYITEQCQNRGFINVQDEASRYCGFPFASRSSSLPEIEQISLFADSSFEINSRNKFGITAIATRQLNEWVYAPSVGGPSVGFIIPADKAGTIYNGQPLPGTTGTDDVYFTYRTEALGDRITQTTADSYYVHTNYQNEFLETWAWDSSLTFGYTSSEQRSPQGYALKAQMLSAVSDGFNPFDPNTDQSILRRAAYEPWQKTSSNSIVADSNINGELIEFGNGMVLASAFGIQYIHSEFRDRVDGPTIRGEVFGSAGSNGEGVRDVGAAYYEFGLTSGKTWEVQFAGRYDRYSDFGDTFNPKLGVKYRPFHFLMFRGSVGKTFKAPNLVDLNRSSSIGYPAFIDRKRCPKNDPNADPTSPACRESQYEVEFTTNADLREQTATTFSAGFVVEPVAGLTFTTDYWALNRSNIIGIDYEEMTKAEAAGVDVTKYGVTIERDPTSDAIVKVTAPRLNLDDPRISGVDFELSYKLGTSFGVFRFADYHSIIIEDTAGGFPGIARRDYKGDYGSPEWKNSASLSFAPNRNHTISLSYSLIGGQRNIKQDGRISTYGELGLAYNTNYLSKWWKGTTLTAGIQNLTGETPPHDPVGGPDTFRTELYPLLQRYAYVNLRHTF